MSTLTIPDVPVGTENPAQRLRRIAAAVRVRLRWWRALRLMRGRREEMGAVTSADARLLTAWKKLINSAMKPSAALRRSRRG